MRWWDTVIHGRIFCSSWGIFAKYEVSGRMGNTAVMVWALFRGKGSEKAKTREVSLGA